MCGCLRQLTAQADGPAEASCAQASPGRPCTRRTMVGTEGRKSTVRGKTHPPRDQVQTLTAQSLYDTASGQRAKCKGVGGNKRYFFDLRKGLIPGTSKTCLVITHPAFKGTSPETCPPPLESALKSERVSDPSGLQLLIVVSHHVADARDLWPMPWLTPGT